MQLFFTKHALDKLDVLARHQVTVTKSQVEETASTPDSRDDSRSPLLFVEKALNETHVLRVAYKLENDINMIITFYPVKKKADE